MTAKGKGEGRDSRERKEREERFRETFWGSRLSYVTTVSPCSLLQPPDLQVLRGAGGGSTFWLTGHGNGHFESARGRVLVEASSCYSSCVASTWDLRKRPRFPGGGHSVPGGSSTRNTVVKVRPGNHVELSFLTFLLLLLRVRSLILILT